MTSIQKRHVIRGLTSRVQVVEHWLSHRANLILKSRTQKGAGPPNAGKAIHKLIAQLNGGCRKLTAAQYWGKQGKNSDAVHKQMRDILGLRDDEEVPTNAGGNFDLTTYNRACKELFAKESEEVKAQTREALLKDASGSGAVDP